MDRFWAKVNKSRGECWEWTACKTGDGYGQFSLKGQAQLAHRVSWRLANGEIPDGMCVCHSCDTPSCVNPAHLFLGTQSDNMADMKKKGRHKGWDMTGEKGPNARLDNESIIRIRDYIKSGMSQSKIADIFGVSQTAICHINTGAAWSHI